MNPIPVELPEFLKRGECVLFVGAGLSEGLPTWKELMNPLAQEVDTNPDEDPRYISEYYENQFGRQKLEEKIVAQLKKDVPLTKTHKILAELPVKAIITTNYDHLLEKALSQRKFVKIVRGTKAPQVGADELPLVKMHGDLDDPSTMVITKTDYDEYPEKHRALITYLLGFLISCNFLFVGFSLKDPNFDNIHVQMRSLFKDTQRKSYALFKNPPDNEVKRLNKIGIEIIKIEDYNEIPLIFEELAEACDETILRKIDYTPRQLEHVQKTFREVVERQNKWLDPRGIFQFERMLTRREVELEEVYVVPRLVKQIIMRKRKDEKRDDKRREKLFGEDLNEKNLNNKGLIEKRKEVEPEEYIFEKNVEVTIKEALSDSASKHMVILGDPGIGKSCLLQYIALKASTNVGESLGIERPLLPVLIPLREYPQFGSKKMLKDFIFDYIQKRICSLPENVLESFLEKNLFFFLLDGLDEVVSESERIDVSRQVEQFMAQYPRMKIVLTSRPAGYRPAALIGSIPHFTLADFNNEEIKEFLVKWFTFLDKIEEEKFDAAKTEKKAYDLAEILVKREKILHLARNPLLLTILVLIQRIGGKLPERRVEFYDLAVKTIAGSWEIWKNLQMDKRKNLPTQKMIFAILEKVSFKLHNEKQENVVGVKELEIWLKEIMEEEMGYSSDKEIEDFIWMVNERVGLLVERGVELYGFVHLTFQEYFAARYIALGRGIRMAQDLISENLHSSYWREVFLLAAAIASPEQANLILDSALKAENPFEEYIHSNLLVAGLMLANLPMVDSQKRKDIINRLISLTEKESVDLLRIEAIEVLGEIGRTSVIENNSWALELLKDEDWYVRRQAVQYFTTIGGGDSHIQEKIFTLLKDEDRDVRRLAVQYFTTIGGGDSPIQEKIFTLLKDEDGDVRRLAVQYFTTIGGGDSPIQEKIFTLLKDEDWDVREQAVQYFTTIGGGDSHTQEKIFTLLKDETYLPSSDRILQDVAVEFLSRYAREESMEKVSTLFKLSHQPTKRGAYKLMKALLQTQEPLR